VTSQFDTDAIVGAIYANGIWVAYGANGKISTSPDGTTWTARTSQFGTSTINGVIWSPSLSLFVAVGTAAKLSTSPDGITWTARTSGFDVTQDIAVIHEGGGSLVIGGSAGVLATSPDGITWTLKTSRLREKITGLAYGNGTWVARVNSGSPQISTSTDTNTWNLYTSRFTSAGSTDAMIFANGIFVLSPTGLNPLTSVDGKLWLKRGLEIVTLPTGQMSLFYLNGVFFGLGSTSTLNIRTLDA
jgi:hypothetical protein